MWRMRNHWFMPTKWIGAFYAFWNSAYFAWPNAIIFRHFWASRRNATIYEFCARHLRISSEKHACGSCIGITKGSQGFRSFNLSGVARNRQICLFGLQCRISTENTWGRSGFPSNSLRIPWGFLRIPLTHPLGFPLEVTLGFHLGFP